MKILRKLTKARVKRRGLGWEASDLTGTFMSCDEEVAAGGVVELTFSRMHGGILNRNPTIALADHLLRDGGLVAHGDSYRMGGSSTIIQSLQ
jgi:hypothetical protein